MGGRSEDKGRCRAGGAAGEKKGLLRRQLEGPQWGWRHGEVLGKQHSLLMDECAVWILRRIRDESVVF